MNIEFTKVEGPECPNCGSQFSEQIPNQGFGITGVFHAVFGKGAKLVLLQCNHCSKVFSANEEEIGKKNKKNNDGIIDDEFVEFIRTKCRYCGSQETTTTSTRKNGIRHHKCKDCNRNFKSKAL